MCMAMTLINSDHMLKGCKAFSQCTLIDPKLPTVHLYPPQQVSTQSDHSPQLQKATLYMAGTLISSGHKFK